VTALDITRPPPSGEGEPEHVRLELHDGNWSVTSPIEAAARAIHSSVTIATSSAGANRGVEARIVRVGASLGFRAASLLGVADVAATAAISCDTASCFSQRAIFAVNPTVSQRRVRKVAAILGCPADIAGWTA